MEPGKSISDRSTRRSEAGARRARPAGGKRGDRGKLLYELSEQGRKNLGDWLAQAESGPQELREEIYVKLLLATRLANGNLRPLLGRQKRAYLQWLRDLDRIEARARQHGRMDLARLVRGALLHAEADIQWIDEISETATSGESA